jgi:hypothetical protein
MRNRYLLLLICLLSLTSYAQYSVRGIVVDKDTREPLAFANLLFDNNNQLAMPADIDGKFTVTSAAPLHRVYCSYVGYDAVEVKIESGKPLIIEMVSQNNLEEVVIRPGENPAHRIIRMAILNKKINNPENISSFTYECYNKIVYDFKPDGLNENDSVARSIKTKMKGSSLFMMESVSERKFIAPDKSEEVVVATKVSGFKNPTFASLATDLQPFSFYNDNIPLFDVQYLNPISKGSLKKYNFRIEDTIFQKQDTVYIISFSPKKGKNIEGLKGTLYINTNRFAVQNVIATPAVKGKIDIKIQQQYSFIDGKYWFPEQLNYVLSLPSYSIQADGRSYISKVKTDIPLNRKEFSLESVRMDKNAARKDSVFWQNIRTEELTTGELRTYQMIDSIGEVANFDRMLSLMERLPQGRLPIGVVDIDLAKTLVYNKYEGFRPGLGLYTNDRLIRDFSIGAFAGYGLKDYEWKYGAEAIYKISEKHEFELRAKFQDNLTEAGSYGLNYSVGNFLNARNFLASMMDHNREYSFDTSFRMLKYLKWNLIFNNSDISPLYEYAFNAPGGPITSYTNTTFRADLRFGFKERFVHSLNQRISMGTTWPVLTVSYTKGFDGVLDGELDYTKLEARLEQSFFSRNFGTTKYRLEAGHIDKALPYGLLFTGEGSHDKEYPVIIKNYFQTMMPYEFVSDKYANLFLSHNFGTLLFQVEEFSPSISIHHNMGWGELSNSNRHLLMEVNSKDKIFLESGLQLDNVYKVNYMNVGYLGVGFGAFFRYGAYEFPKTSDNFVLKFTATYSFK